MSKSKNKNILNWLPLCIFISLLLISIFSFAYGYDYFWHVKSGEYIVNNLKIPYYDIFSWYGITNHLYWFSHEWLSEVVIYLFKYLFKEGAFVYCLVMLTLLITLLTYFLKDKISKNIYFSSGWALLGMLTLIKVLLPRPHMISFILLVITMHLLYDNFYNDSKKIYFLPLISLCWANFHGGSSNLTYILCLIFMIAGLFNFKFGKIEAQKLTKKQIKRFLLVAIMSFLVLAINPHGIKLWLYPYQNMQDSLMINSILEWHSPSLNNPNDYTAFLILGFIILCMIITKNKIKLIDFCVLGFFLILGFKSIRFIPLLYIGASFAIFNLVKEQQATYHNKFVLTLLVFVLIFAFLIQSPKLANNITHNKLIPDKIINYIKEQKPKRLFNYYNYGGYLIYNDIKVFVDGRADMYSNNILQDVVDLQDKGYLFLMKKYDFDMYVVPNDISLTLQLIENSDYCITQQEDNVIIFEKISNCGL